jgi:hypothetical protein
MTKSNAKTVAALSLAIAASLPVRAVDDGGISIHGSVSMTESWSNTYNFYGDTADEFDNNVRELTLNGGYRWADGLRFSVQGYASTVDGLSSLDLDFASLDYSFNQEFGVRIGRNKSSLGLYGDSQDLDQVRTFANLPLGLYPRNIRPFNYTDGISFYGNLPAGKAGSFDYTAFAGRIENIGGNALIARAAGGLTVTDDYTIPAAYGINFFWNLPVDGLRLGFTVINLPHIGAPGHLATEAFATNPGLTYDATPLGIDAAYGAGTWDYAFAGTPVDTTVGLSYRYLSAEYTTGKWVFASEVRRAPEHSNTSIPALGVANSYAKTSEIDTYFMATYQATKTIGLGAYYGYTNTNTMSGNSSEQTQGDVAAVVSYAPVSWWIFKVEFHQMDGLGLVDSAGDFNPNAPTAGIHWNYLVLKTTFSF